MSVMWRSGAESRLIVVLDVAGAPAGDGVDGVVVGGGPGDVGGPVAEQRHEPVWWLGEQSVGVVGDPLFDGACGSGRVAGLDVEAVHDARPALGAGVEV